MSADQCKVLVYDEMVKLETAQKNIQILNQRIAELAKVKVEDVKKAEGN